MTLTRLVLLAAMALTVAFIGYVVPEPVSYLAGLAVMAVLLLGAGEWERERTQGRKAGR